MHVWLVTALEPLDSRLRPNMRLKQLFREWKDGNKPRPQTALEFEAAIDDFIDFAGDISISMIDPDLLNVTIATRPLICLRLCHGPIAACRFVNE